MELPQSPHRARKYDGPQDGHTSDRYQIYGEGIEAYLYHLPSKPKKYRLPSLIRLSLLMSVAQSKDQEQFLESFNIQIIFEVLHEYLNNH